MLSYAPHGKRLTALLLFICLILLASTPMVAGAQDTMEEDSLFISIRLYGGLESDENIELFLHTAEEFMGIIRETDGYIGYYWLYSGESVAAISLFDSQAQATASNEAAADYVAANLADLVPEPPTIIEGQVDIGFVEMLDGMSDGEVANLHASVRLYEDFAAEDLNEFVTIVDDGFVPLMRETDGFFGYYLMNNGAGTLGAISIFDSEASALASNEHARDFVAENLTAFLPSSPTIVSGPVHIASLMAIHQGTNLIVDDVAEDVFVSIRVYDGIDPSDRDEIVRLVDPGFLTIMSESDGFVGYYLLPAGDKLAAISLFDSAEQASASNEAARDYVVEYMAPLLPNPPLIVEGALDVTYVVDEMMGDGSLYAALRIYDNYDLTERDKAVELVETGFLPILQGADGLFSYFSMDDGVDRVVALSVYDTEENALAANTLAADFVAEYMSQWITEDPTRINGRLGVTAMADLNMGMNLITDEHDDRVFASIRVYDGVDPTDHGEIVRLVDDGFLPIMRQSEGFAGYYLLPAADKLAAISLFNTPEQAAASNAAARDFVVENLAPLLPNSPTIFEGHIDISFVTDDRLADSMSSLYASLRIYTVGDMGNLEESNRLVNAHLLPALIESGGLFSYLSMSDAEDTIVGLNIYQSEANALAANDIAAAFVAEHLMDWLPDDPLRVTGRLGVAALADMHMGENLIANVHDEAFVSIRVYDGIDPADRDEIVRLVDPGFLTIMSESDGFVGYYLLPAGDKLAAVSIFDSAEQASASNEAARDYVAEFMAPLLPNPPLIVEGALDVMYVADEMMSDAGGSLYAALRIYDNYDLSERDKAVELVETGFLPILQGADGLFSYFTMDDGVDRVVALSVYDTEENALAANTLAADFVAEYMSQWIPEDPTRINGRLGVTAFADIQMGENLISSE